MHYFQFEIKEWIANTAHLTLEEEAAYLRLIFYYYDSEKPIRSSDAAMVFRKCRIPHELGLRVLSEFFTEYATQWIHARCDKEIQAYKAKSDRAKANAEKRWHPVVDATAMQPHSDRNANHKSIINNQIKKRQSKIAPPDGVSESLWSDFLVLRKSKRLPLTPTALKGLEREAGLARKSIAEVIQICCERGWGGFKAEWLANAPAKTIPDPPPKKWHQTVQGIVEKARELGIQPQPGGTIGQLEETIRRHLGE